MATDLWFWSVCSGNALYPCARALFWTEQVQEPCCAPVELGHRLINGAAQTSLNMVRSRRKARPFGLSTKLGLQENGRPSPKGTAMWPGPYSMD